MGHEKYALQKKINCGIFFILWKMMWMILMRVFLFVIFHIYMFFLTITMEECFSLYGWYSFLCGFLIGSFFQTSQCHFNILIVLVDLCWLGRNYTAGQHYYTQIFVSVLLCEFICVDVKHKKCQKNRSGVLFIPFVR